MKKGISVYILFIIMGIIAMGSILYAAQEYIEYIVKKGDTQWDIAEKTLKDPYDWPKVWVVNPEIKNPDLIYPGQRIRIPIRLVKESVKKEALEVKSAGEQKKRAGIGHPGIRQSGQQEFFTVQIGSFPDMDNSERAYDRAVRLIKKSLLDYLRIELVKGYHTVRIGRFEHRDDAKRLLRAVRKVFPGAIVLKAYVKEERIKRLYGALPPAEQKVAAEVTAPVREEKERPIHPGKGKKTEAKTEMKVKTKKVVPSVKKREAPEKGVELVEKTGKEVTTEEGLIPLKIPFEVIRKKFEEKEKSEIMERERLSRLPEEKPPEPVSGKDELTREGLLAFHVSVREAALKRAVVKKKEKADIAVLPLENLSSAADAVGRVMPVLRGYIEERGLKVLDDSLVRDFMVKNRFRERGVITSELSRRLREQYGVHYAYVGSIITFKDANPPKFALIGRVVDTSNGDILWTNYASATGNDFAGLFGVGKITEMDRLIPVVVKRFISSLSEDALTARKDGRLRIAVLPFRNATKMVGAGKIAAYMFLSGLMNVPGLQPVEYGDIRKEVISLNMREIGELSFSSIEGLSKTMNIDLILLGSVEEYSPSVVEAIPPRVSFTSKLIDAHSKRLLWLDDIELDGNDEIKILDLGKLRSVDMVAYNAVRKMIKRMEERIW